MTQRAAVYVRLSRYREEDPSLAPERQEASCRRKAQEKGWQVGSVYSDLDVSGWSGVDRPEFNRLLADVKAGLVDVVMVWKLDRAARNVIKLLELGAFLQQHGVEFVSVSDSIDTTTPTGRFAFTLFAALAELESDTISYRLIETNRDAAERGLPHPSGARPFGFDQNGMTVRPDEAAAVQKVAAMILDGSSIYDCARWLNDQGIFTPQGNPWRGASVRRMIANPRYIAKRVHRPKQGPVQMFDAVWPRILDQATWDGLTEMFDGRRTGKGQTTTTLLTGLAVCSICGGKLRPKTNNSIPSYVCNRRPGTTNCGKVSIKRHNTEADNARRFIASLLHLVGIEDRAATQPMSTEEEVTEQIIKTLAAGKLPGAEDSSAMYEIQLAKLIADRDALAASYGAGDIAESEWRALRAPLAERIEQLESALRAAPRGSMNLATLPTSEDELRHWWSGAAIESRRAVVAALIQKVEISPVRVRGSRIFDPNRISVSWKL